MPDLFKMRDENGAESAPFDGDTLIACAHKGIILPATMICDMAIGRWMPAAEHPLLGGPPLAPAASATLPARQSSPAYPPQAARNAGSSIALACIVGVSAFTVVFFALTISKNYSHYKPARTGPVQTIATADGRYAVSLPGDWIRWRTRRSEIVEYTSPDRQTGVAVVKVSRVAVDAAGLEAMMERGARASSEKINGTPLGSPHPVSVNGMPGYAQDLQDGHWIHRNQYRYLLLQTPEGAYTLMSFASTRSDLSLSDLDKFTQSFHSLSARPASLATR